MILSYEQIKALLTSWALNDARIPTGGILFGESRKLLDAQRTEIQYPYFWVEEIAARVERSAEGTQIDQLWQIDISVKKNSSPDNYEAQEEAKSLCFNICVDFVKFLSDLHLQGEILFDQRNVSIREAEFFEGDVDYGYQMSVAFGEPITNICAPSPYGRHGIKALNLMYADEVGVLALDINGIVYQTNWDTATHTHSQILHLLTQIINVDEAQTASAFTDGVYLFIKDTVGTDPVLDLEPAANTHTWGIIISHESSEGIEIEAGIVYQFATVAGPQGPPGPAGADGAQGIDGADGDSAYQVWIDEGNVGTEQDFLDSLQGADGNKAFLQNAAKFSDSTYDYFVGDVEGGWQVNRWETDTSTETKATGTGSRPSDLPTLQGLTYS